MFDNLFRSNPELAEVMANIPTISTSSIKETVPKPMLGSRPVAQSDADAKSVEYMKEYAELSAALGMVSPNLAIEAFKAFLLEKNLPIYALQDVIAYMDEKAKKESKEQAGWEWRPLREKDSLLLKERVFGTRAEWQTNAYGHRDPSKDMLSKQSDYFLGASEMLIDPAMRVQDARPYTVNVPASSSPYDRTIPLHAIRRVATIEKEFGGPVAFFVSDYALAPTVPHPDPFLMAVISNPNLHRGEGRFVIDFWDEPGFGINQMLGIEEYKQPWLK